MTNALKSNRSDYVTAERSEAALLGAAVGDALGWPHEMQPRRKRSGHSNVLGYQDWTKRGGGQYQPFEERIDAGSYSDDTQLILAVARCLTRAGDRWWEQFAYKELPFWTLYERGGGGATKRAAMSWMNGSPPWVGKPDDIRRYFEAGGNGVAMRVLPHCIAFADDDFASLARSVMTDGITTHGHPRALIGALAYAFAVWTALRHRGTLSFGQLVTTTISATATWAPLVSIDQAWPDWRDTAVRTTNYQRLWEEAVDEQVRLLELGSEAIDAGAASFDEEILEKLGCFDKRVNGSGTVSAAGAIYLASRHAADPMEGLRVSALAHGADTDTLASMTCALLGSAVGGDWFQDFLGGLQDRDVLISAARNLLIGKPHLQLPLERLSRNGVAAFKDQLRKQSQGALALPIGMDAEVKPWDGLRSKGRSMQAHSWQAHAENGQSFYFKFFSRDSQAEKIVESTAGETDPQASLRLAVADLELSRRFYETGLGLKVSQARDRTIWFGRSLAIDEKDAGQVNPGSILLYIAVSKLEERLQRLTHGKASILSPITTRGDRRHFRCMDPDGYQLEVYEKIA